jgi:hypothetical protein
MTIINAWQHIYSNVEKERSPQGRGGFQTLFYSHNGLSEDEVEEMESYLLYFPSDVEPVKRLFFATSTGKGVVAQIVFLPNPDQFGRGGRYLAHSLIFAPDDLPRFEADPFRVFRQFSFVATVEDALAKGNFKTGNISTVSLDLPDTPANEVNAARNWPAAELKKLSLLALRAEQQANNREAITVNGQPEEIEQALQAAFLAVPVSNRLHCSFDTYFYRCNLVATYFWAIGLPEPPVSIKFAQVNGPARQVEGQITGQPETAYERWVIQEIDSGNLDGIAGSRDCAFALGEWLDGRAYDLDQLNASSNKLITSMFAVSASSVQRMLRSQIRKKLPVSLVDRAAQQVYRQASALDLYRQLRQGFELSQLVDILYQSYAGENFKEPSRQEVKDLEQLLPQVEHPMLQLFIAYWISPRKDLPTALERTTENNYRQFAKTSKRLELLKPYVLLVPGRGDGFLDLYLNDMKNDLVDLSEALIDVGELDCLVRLNPYLPDLSGKALKKLAKLAEEYPNIPEPFRSAVKQAILAQPEKTGIKGMFRKVFGFSTKEK